MSRDPVIRFPLTLLRHLRQAAGIHKIRIYKGSDWLLYSLYVGRLFVLNQEIGFTHMRILEGLGTQIQLGGLLARLCKMVRTT